MLLPRLKIDSGSGSGFCQIFDSGSETKTQNPVEVDCGTPDPVPPLPANPPKIHFFIRKHGPPARGKFPFFIRKHGPPARQAGRAGPPISVIHVVLSESELELDFMQSNAAG